jgi:hypothetical protein
LNSYRDDLHLTYVGKATGEPETKISDLNRLAKLYKIDACVALTAHTFCLCFFLTLPSELRSIPIAMVARCSKRLRTPQLATN